MNKHEVKYRVRLIGEDLGIFDIVCNGQKITNVQSVPSPSTEDVENASLLIPSLSHAHIHLDKCFLSSSLQELQIGDFAEALRVTSRAKAGFTRQDVVERGRRLIRESIQWGVTCLRAHVEVDKTVRLECLEAALQLKQEFEPICDVEIAVFAQDPFYGSADSQEASENLELLRIAAAYTSVSVVGSAPYVEANSDQALQNIGHVLELACKHGLHADFHLDYHLDQNQRPLIHDLVAQLDRLRTRWPSERMVTIGHATALCHFSADDWKSLIRSLTDLPMKVAFVGLPQSDLYMMDREARLPARGTLPVSKLALDYPEVTFAMAVNNVRNPFTPQGGCDPLSLLPLGVAIYQTATAKACEVLLRLVTINAKAAIGLPYWQQLSPQVGDLADFVLVPGATTLIDVVLDSPWERVTVKGGRIVAHRRTELWLQDLTLAE